MEVQGETFFKMSNYSLNQCCLIGLLEMMEILCVYAVQYASC